MLFDDTTAIDGDDLTVGESLTNETHGQVVEVGLAIDWTEYSPVDDQKIGVGGWQALLLRGPRHNAQSGLVNGSGQGELHQMIRLSFEGAERTELLLHQLEFCVLLISGIVTAHIEQGVVRTDAHQRVDMSIGIIASQRPMIDPEDTFGMEFLQESRLYLRLGEGLVTMRGSRLQSY